MRKFVTFSANFSQASFLGSHQPDTITHSANAFHQPMVICNAVQGWGAATFTKNNMPTKSDKPLGFNECRYIETQMHKQDRLTFNFADKDVQGTFEIDDLPKSDSELLLVVQKSPLTATEMNNDSENSDSKIMSIAFQSFAFGPKSSSEKYAQVAFLNTIPGDKSEMMKMQDKKIGRTTGLREEDVMFNRVYAIDEGHYNLLLSKESLRHLSVKYDQDYIVLKTGSANQPHLLVFPDDFRTSQLQTENLVFYSVVFIAPIIMAGLGFYIFGTGELFQKWKKLRGKSEEVIESTEATEEERVPLNA